jgi:hypothetical protein
MAAFDPFLPLAVNHCRRCQLRRVGYSPLMLAFALTLMAKAPMAVEATGMNPQLRFIRQEAAKRKWPITCVGHSGEEGVLRIGIPPSTPSQAVDDFERAIQDVASSWANLGADAKKATCNREPVRQSVDGVVQVLILSAHGRDPRLLAVAHDCGFPEAYWRATAPEDLARFGGRVDLNKFSNALDAGENVATHYGPTMCWVNMHRTAEKAPVKP